ncbi:hypothetical protein AAFO90_08520 [Phaeobacter sp. CAU 1743]
MGDVERAIYDAASDSGTPGKSDEMRIRGRGKDGIQVGFEGFDAAAQRILFRAWDMQSGQPNGAPQLCL